ncbi:MAG: tyrosine-protein phosphatase [Clostridia bacterium]|nr:tyrosine-protein phosphatase [Clostridia bacterium]
MRIERLKLKKLNNTRDLGGFPAENGKRIKYGKLIRSGKLYKLPKSTVSALEALNVTTVIDLRIEREKYEYPSTEIKGVKLVSLPLVCTATVGITHTKSMARTMLKESKRIKTEFGSADNYMQSVYELLLFNEQSQEKLKEFFKLVSADESCILWHCNAGKDRTGLCAMLLESLLGVDEDLIIKDYCISNKFQFGKRFWQKAGLVIAPIPLRFKQILYALMAAKPQYIKGAITEIKRRYGSVAEYCKQALGVTDEQIKALKDKYLE